MLELFVVGTFWFWALLIAEIVLLFVFVEYENGIGATVSLAVFLGLLQFFGDVDIITFVRSHPFIVAGCVLAYFVLGAVWGIIKWSIFCHDVLEEYEDAKSEWLRDRGQPSGTKVVPPELRADWSRHLNNQTNAYRGGKYIRLGEAPLVRNHKSQIMRWMTFWVVSIIWSFINDFVKRVFRSIYQWMAEFLQRISDNMFAKSNIQEDTKIPE